VIKGIHHASRAVSDMDRSLAFYRDLLGMKVVLDTEMEGAMLSREVALENARLRLVELAPEDESFYLELLEYYFPRGKPYPPDITCADVGADHVALTVESIEDAHRRLLEQGVRFTCEPQEVDAGFFQGHRTAYCYDPDGMIVELWQLPG
jgi:catechol 2,3-dioxygenase-like lactoylglutathione lyase family enzyme